MTIDNTDGDTIFPTFVSALVGILGESMVTSTTGALADNAKVTNVGNFGAKPPLFNI